MGALKKLWLTLASIGLLAACSSGGGGTGQLDVDLGSSGSSSASGLSAALKAATVGEAADVEAVYLTVKEVRVHVSGDGSIPADDDGDGSGWVTVGTPNKTYNLLDLRNCLLEKLGSAKLEAGQKVSQIRLVLDTDASSGHPFANYVVIAGEPTEIKVPSGSTSGLKINQQGPVEIQEDGQVHLTLRIDLDKSLVFTGNGKILLKPVIKASVGGEDADAFVEGTVTADSDASAVEGAIVSAQVNDADEDLADEVKVENSAATDADGNYRICVAPGTYNIVAVKDGFEVTAESVTVTGEDTVDVDFSLTDASEEPGTVTGLVVVPDAGVETPVTLSVRRSIDIDGDATVIEVASIGVANGDAYSVTLAPGDYEIVAFTPSGAAVSIPLTVEAGTETTADVSL